MHVCMYACMHVCMYACMHVWMYVCMYACMHACMYVCFCFLMIFNACMHVCMYACMHVCFCLIHVCMHVCLYVWMDGWMDGHVYIIVYQATWNLNQASQLPARSQTPNATLRDVACRTLSGNQSNNRLPSSKLRLCCGESPFPMDTRVYLV